GIDSPTFLTVGSDGALWYLNSGSQTVGRITTDGQSSAFLLLARHHGIVSAITGTDGNTWFVEQGSSIDRLTPGGTLTVFPETNAAHLVPGPDGNVWFSGTEGIYRIDENGNITSVNSSLEVLSAMV